MNIRAVDIEGFSKLLETKLKAGNKWMVFDPVMFKGRLESTIFFKSEEDAGIFCTINESETTEFRSIAIEPLLQAIQPFTTQNHGRNDIAYYDVDETRLEVDYVLKTDPHLNHLFNSDQFPPFAGPTKRDLIESAEYRPAVAEDFERICKQLSDQGYEPDFFLTLEASMKLGSPKHEEPTFENYGDQLIMYNHLFTKNSDDRYSLDKITGTLYSYMDIDHATIKGINTVELDNQMSDLNWDYDGRRFLKQNEPLFQRLCEDSNGRVIAVQLFNNHAAPFWYEKPDFLSHVEDELKMYPKMDFPGGTPAYEVYEGLKAYQKIATAISQLSIPEATDVNRKGNIVEQLMKGESFPVFASSGPRKGEEVMTINWDTHSKKLSFIFKDEDVVQYIYKKHSPEFEVIKNEVEQYPFRQLGDAAKKQLLVEELMDGHKKPVHLERELVPSEHIDRYIVIERQYPDEQGNYQRPQEMFSYPQADIAISEMKKLAECFVLDGTKSNSALLLVGQYKGTTLQFDKHEMPTINTGFLVETITNISSDGYYPCIEGNIDRTNILVEQVFVERDSASNKLVFSNKHGETIEIDRDFWSPTAQVNLGKELPNAGDDLLTKRRINPDKGLSK